LRDDILHFTENSVRTGIFLYMSDLSGLQSLDSDYSFLFFAAQRCMGERSQGKVSRILYRLIAVYMETLLMEKIYF
jgi:hypothetical protein